MTKSFWIWLEVIVVLFPMFWGIGSGIAGTATFNWPVAVSGWCLFLSCAFGMVIAMSEESNG